MRRATFKMVAAGDGSPPTSTGYCYYLVAHAIATVLLLITLVAGVWQFMDWIGAPSCLASSSPSSVSASTAAGAPSIRLAARAEMAPDPADCPCPKTGK
jgi:hypothetical protein